VSLLTEDASFAMPPLSSWYAPRDVIASWARDFPLNGDWRWRTLLTRANAQPALAFYAWDESDASYRAFALNVLTLKAGAVSDVTAFIIRATDAPAPEAYLRFPEQPIDQRQLSGTFERFGLPERLD
jgi:RNA polymerase sigma-70 factor, ECF subfamily